MLNIELLREQAEINDYFDEVYDFIGENFESEDQAVLESFIEQILETDELDIYQKMQAITNGIESSLSQEMAALKKMAGAVGGAIKNAASSKPKAKACPAGTVKRPSGLCMGQSKSAKSKYIRTSEKQRTDGTHNNARM
jgi:hypothetical protein